jgi:hypothetical protein
MDKRSELHNTYSDAYKEIYGVRPRDCADWTADEFVAELDMLAEESEAMHSAPAQGHGWAYDGDPRALEDF